VNLDEVPTADRELHGINKSQSPMIDESAIRHDQTAQPYPRDRVALIYVTWIQLMSGLCLALFIHMVLLLPTMSKSVRHAGEMKPDVGCSPGPRLLCDYGDNG